MSRGNFLITHVTHKSGDVIKYKWLVRGTSPTFRDNSWQAIKKNM